MKNIVVYSDNHLVIANKPSGILSIPDRYDPNKPNLFNMLKKQFEDILVVHRLDKETSGIICFARTKEAHAYLNEQFRLRNVSKTYVAIINGRPLNPTGKIVTGIAPDPSVSGKMKVIKTGKKSISEYTIIEQFKSCALAEVKIMTGRMHQIRVHMKYIGHPCLVDKIYGNNDSISISDIKQRNVNFAKHDDHTSVLIDRTTLHAMRLTFIHPESEQEITYEAPLPKDMKALLNQLRKWSKE